MQNFGSIYGTDLDPEILDILHEPESRREENPALIGIEEANTRTNEQVVQTAALDSKGRLLHVGDKVVIGNDKSVGRIVALGRHATVSIPNEGTFEFPCSVLELYGAEIDESMNATYRKAYDDATMLLQPGGTKAYTAAKEYEKSQPAAPHNTRAGQATYEEATVAPGKDSKFQSYNLASMMKACAQEEDDFSDVAEANERLKTMFEGQNFNMGINL